MGYVFGSYDEALTIVTGSDVVVRMDDGSVFVGIRRYRNGENTAA